MLTISCSKVKTFSKYATGARCSCRFASTARPSFGRSTSVACSMAVACEPCVRRIHCGGEYIQPGNMQQERASGRNSRGCLAVRGYASAAGVALVGQSFPALRCTVSWRKYLPSSTTD